jgi:hypothetical protein
MPDPMINALEPLAPIIVSGLADEINVTSALMTLVAGKLTDEINNGGYGLNPIDELNLFNRARDREQILVQQGIEEITRNYAMTGFAMPPGPYMKAIEMAQQQATDKISSINRDIALKRADLYAEFKKFDFELGMKMEEVAIKVAQLFVEEDKIAASEWIAQLDSQTRITVAEIDASWHRDVANIEGGYRVQVAIIDASWHANVATIEANARIAVAYIDASWHANVATIEGGYRVQVAEIDASWHANVATIEGNFRVQAAVIDKEARVYAADKAHETIHHSVWDNWQFSEHHQYNEGIQAITERLIHVNE